MARPGAPAGNGRGQTAKAERMEEMDFRILRGFVNPHYEVDSQEIARFAGFVRAVEYMRSLEKEHPSDVYVVLQRVESGKFLDTHRLERAGSQQRSLTMRRWLEVVKVMKKQRDLK